MITRDVILQHIDDIFGQYMHAKRVLSLSNATHGVNESASLAVHAIGACLAQANGQKRKSLYLKAEKTYWLWSRSHLHFHGMTSPEGC